MAPKPNAEAHSQLTSRNAFVTQENIANTGTPIALIAMSYNWGGAGIPWDTNIN